MATPRTTIQDALTLCMGIYGTQPELVFADGQWLLDQGVLQNRELPWWIEGERYAFHFGVVADKAVEAGLRNRPLTESIRDSVEWAEREATIDAAAAPNSQAGQSSGYWNSALSRERELELIELWRAHAG
jgi:2'-hydroxyisoflavone reductase